MVLVPSLYQTKGVNKMFNEYYHPGNKKIADQFLLLDQQPKDVVGYATVTHKYLGKMAGVIIGQRAPSGIGYHYRAQAAGPGIWLGGPKVRVFPTLLQAVSFLANGIHWGHSRYAVRHQRRTYTVQWFNTCCCRDVCCCHGVGVSL